MFHCDTVMGYCDTLMSYCDTEVNVFDNAMSMWYCGEWLWHCDEWLRHCGEFPRSLLLFLEINRSHQQLCMCTLLSRVIATSELSSVCDCASGELQLRPIPSEHVSLLPQVICLVLRSMELRQVRDLNSPNEKWVHGFVCFTFMRVPMAYMYFKLMRVSKASVHLTYMSVPMASVFFKFMTVSMASMYSTFMTVLSFSMYFTTQPRIQWDTKWRGCGVAEWAEVQHGACNH